MPVKVRRFSGLSLLIVAAALLVVLSGCSSAADSESAANTPAAAVGVTDTEIKLGTHFPLSQTPAAAYAPLAYAMRAYFDYVNEEQGGVNGRKITLLISDDHYNPADTVEVVRELVEKEQVFAIVGGLGDATHRAVGRYLEERGVPDLFISSGSSAWTDPVVRTRFAGNPDYVTEGMMLGRYIGEKYDGKKLGLLLQSDGFGDDGEEGLRRGFEGSNVEIVAIEKYEAVQFDVTAQAQRLRNAGAEVVAAFALPPQAASLVKNARQAGWDAPIVVSGVNCTEIFINLAGAENAEGVVSIVFANQIYRTDLPGVAKHIEIMEKYGRGQVVSNVTLYGQAIAELTVEALKNAGPDLTRDSLVEGAEAIRDFQCSVCMTPINLSPTDHRPFETEVYNRVEGGKWVPFGAPVSFETTQD